MKRSGTSPPILSAIRKQSNKFSYLEKLRSFSRDSMMCFTGLKSTSNGLPARSTLLSAVDGVLDGEDSTE
jgi:hypothetical protein